MNKTTLILLLLLLLPFSASADENVSLEIFLNSNSEYYVGVDGGSLQPCLSGMCNVTIDRNMTTNANISDKDIRNIALQTATEINSLTFTTDSLNKSETTAIVNDVMEKRFASYKEFVMRTQMPQTSDFTNLSVELEKKKGEVNKLLADSEGYATKLQAQEVAIDLLNRKLDEYTFILVIVIGMVFWFWIPKTQLFQEWKSKRRIR